MSAPHRTKKIELFQGLRFIIPKKYRIPKMNPKNRFIIQRGIFVFQKRGQTFLLCPQFPLQWDVLTNFLPGRKVSDV